MAAGEKFTSYSAPVTAQIKLLAKLYATLQYWSPFWNGCGGGAAIEIRHDFVVKCSLCSSVIVEHRIDSNMNAIMYLRLFTSRYMYAQACNGKTGE